MVKEQKHEITVTAEGDIVSEERAVKIGQLPAPVQDVANAFGDVSTLILERMSLVLYEVETESDGETKEILVDATGRKVTIEYGADDEDEEHDEDDE